jgi:hypothetical protein
MQEQRTAKRIRVSLEARWEGVFMKDSGSISDISASGCFLLTGGEVTASELVRLWIEFPDDQTVAQWGEVVYPVNDMGFALRFVFNDKDDVQTLERLVDSLPNRG